MKKILVMSALVAFSAAFVACSSNDDLVQQKPDVPEETIEGTPLTIKVTDATRGTDWTATSLPSFTLYSTEHGGTTRWLGERDALNPSTSAGVVFGNTDDTGNPGAYTGDFTNADGIVWPAVTDPVTYYDFYAISDATFATEDDGQGGDQEAEHLDAANRNFTYTVPTDYNFQSDLLVAAAMNKKSDDNGGVVSLPFQHALAQIAQLEFKFKDDENPFNDHVLIIKSVTLHNINSTGTYTFPDTWSNTTYKDGTWTGQKTPTDYHVELPQFQLENNNYKIFDEEPDQTSSSLFECVATQFAENTSRGNIDGLPNYFRTPVAGVEASYIIPLAKKEGSEGTYTGTDDYDITQAVYTATDAEYTVDGGLYVIPQSLEKTVWTKDNGGHITGVTSGVYAEIEGLVLYETSTNAGGPYDPDNGEPFEVDAGYVGTANRWNITKLNNASITQVLNHDDYIVHYWVPLDLAEGKTKKVLKAGGRYKLTFNLSQAVSPETQEAVYFGVTIKD